jgi:hypothetical protein
VGLATRVRLELNGVRRVGLEVVEPDRRSVAGEDGEDLGALGELRRVSLKIEPAPPQATISPSTKPTASPFTKRPFASSRAAEATEPAARPMVS